jgi:predicted RNase H-like HicB family nuclease
LTPGCQRGIRALEQQTAGEKMTFKVMLEKSEEGGFTVYVPSLPGCISEGDTREEALKNIREAIELYLEPTDDDLFLTENKEMEEVVL